MGKIGGLCVASCFVVAACASGAARRQRDRELAALRAKELARQVAQFEALWMHEVRSDSTYELHVPTLDGMMALVVAKGDELTVRGRICELESSADDNRDGVGDGAVSLSQRHDFGRLRIFL